MNSRNCRQHRVRSGQPLQVDQKLEIEWPRSNQQTDEEARQRWLSDIPPTTIALHKRLIYEVSETFGGNQLGCMVGRVGLDCLEAAHS